MTETSKSLTDIWDETKKALANDKKRMNEMFDRRITNLWFKQLMERKLELRSDRGSWRKESTWKLLNALQGEVDELIEGMNKDDPMNIIEEAVDIAIYAMFIADVTNIKMRGEDE